MVLTFPRIILFHMIAYWSWSFYIVPKYMDSMVCRENACFSLRAPTRKVDRFDQIVADEYLRVEKTNISKRRALRMYRGIGMRIDIWAILEYNSTLSESGYICVRSQGALSALRRRPINSLGTEDSSMSKQFLAVCHPPHCVIYKVRPRGTWIRGLFVMRV